MTRTQFDSLSENVVRAYNDMEDEILRLIAKQIAKDGAVNGTSAWRIRQLARAGQLDKGVLRKIKEYAPMIDDEVYKSILQTAMMETTYVDSAVAEAVGKGLIDDVSEISAEDSVMEAMKSFQDQAWKDTNLVNTVMQYKAHSSYVDAINDVYYDLNRQGVLDVMGTYSNATVMGQMSLQEATRKCIHALALRGIPAFVDKRGREWSPEAYVMMDMRSTLANTARQAQNNRCDEFGINLISVSSHMGARPLCAPFQGRIFSRDGSRGTTTDGNGNKVEYIPLTETSYGEPAGLFGINCGHIQYPFIAGISVQRYFPYDEEKNANRYKEFQTQRKMEREIKSWKRECMMLQTIGDEEGLKSASQNLRKAKQKYKGYCENKGLGMHLDRTQVYGYDRSKSMKTVWAERKKLDKSGC